jgi:hypothetical protein
VRAPGAAAEAERVGDDGALAAAVDGARQAVRQSGTNTRTTT